MVEGVYEQLFAFGHVLYLRRIDAGAGGVECDAEKAAGFGEDFEECALVFLFLCLHGELVIWAQGVHHPGIRHPVYLRGPLE